MKYYIGISKKDLDNIEVSLGKEKDGKKPFSMNDAVFLIEFNEDRGLGEIVEEIKQETGCILNDAYSGVVRGEFSSTKLNSIRDFFVKEYLTKRGEEGVKET